jgi:hypothetical protein
MEIVENTFTKMKTSGHTEEFIRQTVEQGIRTFEDRVTRSCLDRDHPGFQPMFPKAGWRRDQRAKSKGESSGEIKLVQG